MVVSGEPLRLNHSSDQKLRRILRKKNARVESAWHYVMPYNMIFRHTEEQAFRMDQTMQALVPLHVRAYITEAGTGRTGQARVLFKKSLYAVFQGSAGKAGRKGRRGT